MQNPRFAMRGQSGEKGKQLDVKKNRFDGTTGSIKLSFDPLSQVRSRGCYVRAF